MARKKFLTNPLLLFFFYAVVCPSLFFWSLVGLDKLDERWLSPSFQMALSHLLLSALFIGAISFLPGGLSGWGVNLKNWRRSLFLSIILGIGFGILFSVFSLGPKISAWKFSHMLGQFHVRENLIQMVSQLFLVGLSEELYFRGILLTSLKSFFSKKTIGIHSANMIVSFGFAAVQFYKLIFGASLGSILPLFAGALLYGIVLGEVYLRTMSLLGPVLIHSLGNSLMFLSSLGI
jgi:membrane protease YdiL (CAAX protease family)